MNTVHAALLLQAMEAQKQAKAQPNASCLRVSEAISTAAAQYEKARNIIDFKAEHLVRKSAIERIMKRRLKFSFGTDRKELAMLLIKELIRLRYLPNDCIPETAVGEVQAIIERYLAIAKILGAEFPFDRRADWLLSMCAVELEEYFAPQHVEHAVVQVFYDMVKPHIEVPEIDEKTLQFHMYMAVYRALRKADAGMLEYHLLKMYVPQWGPQATVDAAMAVELMKARDAMREQMKHPLAKRLLAQMRKVTPPFIILESMLKEKADEMPKLLQDKNAMTTAIGTFVEERYKASASRLWRRGIRALIYILVTKVVIGVALELPYDYYLVKAIHPLPFIINIFAPPILLFLILLALRQPDKDNTTLITKSVLETLYQDEARLVFAGTKRIVLRKKNTIAFVIYTLLYAALFFLIYGGLAAILRAFHFNAVSTSLFLIFISIVSFFGMNLRQAVRELMMAQGKERLSTVVFNALTLPILTAGRWMSENVSRVNVFLFVMDVLIEAPFQFIMESLESWFDYLKEKKEEI